jgi:sugar lactone lactonase YvrE
VATDEAYNRWGGESLYHDGSHTMPNGRAYMTSFNRPYDDGAGAYSVLWWERHVVRYLEQGGYDVTYGTSIDVSRFGDFYEGIGAIVAAGHDEYWTAQERIAADAALASGKTSLINLSANPAYWRIRLEPDAHGRPFRRVVCYKNEQTKDPALAQGAPSTSRFRDDPNPHPENGLYGSMYEDWALMGYPLTLSDVSHPLFAGTGFRQGDSVPGLVGYEYDRMFDNGATPPGTTALITSPLVNAEGWPSSSQVVTRTTPQGRMVFSSGTISWALALSDEPDRQDTRVWNFTWNVLESALAHRRAARPLPGFPVIIRGEGPVIPRWAHTVAAVAGLPGVHKLKDGPVSQASFQAPVGLAVGADSAVYVADSTANVIRMVKGGQVTTIAGTGVGGLQDGPGAQAMFNVPTGLAMGADGAIYVADSQNHVVRRIAADAAHTVTTYAGTRTSFGGYADGPGAGAKFFFPMGLAFDPTSHVLYVADEENNLVRAIAPDAAHTVSTYAGTYNGYADGPALSAAFNFPTGVAVGPDGTVYVLDTGNARIRRIARSSNPVVETVTGTGSKGFADGWGHQAKLQGEDGILWMPSGVLWTDSASNRVRQLFDGSPGTLVDATHVAVTTFAGDGRVGANLSTADKTNVVTPAGIAVGPSGELYVSDTGNGVIRVFTP